jgi:hypothetical protein
MMRYIRITNLDGDEVFIGARLCTVWDGLNYVFPNGIQMVYAGTNIAVKFGSPNRRKHGTGSGRGRADPGE